MTDNSSQDSATSDANNSSDYQGNEPVFGMFSQTKVAVNGLRLTIGEKPFQSIGDLGSQLESVRREFLNDKDCIKALQAVNRIWSSLGQRTQTWESEAQNQERNKARQSGETIRKMRAEHSRVRNSITGLDRMFSKLSTDLNQLCAEDALAKDPNRFDTDSEQDRTEQVDEFEAAMPDEERLAKYSEHAKQILEKIVGDGIQLDYSQAKKVDEKSKIKDKVWDCGGGLFLVCGWYPSDHDVFNVNEYQLRFWLIPKRPELVWGIHEMTKQNQLRLVTNHSDDELGFTRLSCDDSRVPQHEEIKAFVEKIQSQRFGSSDEESGKPFFLFHAKTELANEGTFNCKLVKSK